MNTHKTNRESIETIQVYANSGIDIGSLDANMLREDLHLGIIPYDRNKENIEISLSQSSKEFEEGFIKPLPNQYYRDSYNSIKKIILEFIEYVMLHIREKGIAYFELVEELNTDSPKKFHLVSFFADDIVEKKHFLIQRFTKENQAKFNLPAENKISKAKCFIFRWPELLGGVESYKKIIRDLSGSDEMEKIYSLQMKAFQGKLRSYNFIEHNRILENIKWKITKDIGWHHRRYNDYEQPGTEHYKFGRLLKFKRTKIIIRDSIIEKTKDIINKVSKEFELNTKLEIKGLLSLAEIEYYIDEWYRGTLEYSDVIKIIRK